MTKPSPEIKRRLVEQDDKLRVIRTSSDQKRDVTAAMSAQGFVRTGVMCDLVQVGVM